MQQTTLRRILAMLACTCFVHHAAAQESAPDPAQEAPPDPVTDDRGLTGGTLVFQDDFSDPSLSPEWSSANPDAWHLEGGSVRSNGPYNEALWLQVTLPEQVRIELDAVAHSEAGDIKFEIFGDGATHESGYVVINGGWDNNVTCIARLDEHGVDRLDAPTHVPLEVGRRHQLAVVRTDQRLRFYIDGELVLTFDDAAPLRGPEHQHFGLNAWSTVVEFDNVRVFDVSPQ